MPTAPGELEGGVARELREARLRQRGCTIWLTGRPASGKSTLAQALEQALSAMGQLCYHLDGDVLRRGLNVDLGYTPEDRSENIRRTGEVACLMADSGLIVLASLISPYANDRDRVRKLHRVHRLPFLEVHVDCPLELAERRDPKGLYRRARAGAITGFTGIDAPYQDPAQPELRLATGMLPVSACTERLLDLLREHEILKTAGD
jgi:adenylylsulfate kinase